AVDRRGRRLVPRDPRSGIGPGCRRTASDRRVLRRLADVDVQRRDRGANRRPVLPGEAPHAGGVVEAAGLALVVAERRRVLVPRRPWDVAPGAREVDRRRLGVLARVEVQRAGERLGRTRLAVAGSVAAGRPGAVGERPYEDLVVGGTAFL